MLISSTGEIEEMIKEHLKIFVDNCKVDSQAEFHRLAAALVAPCGTWIRHFVFVLKFASIYVLKKPGFIAKSFEFEYMCPFCIEAFNL